MKNTQTIMKSKIKGDNIIISNTDEDEFVYSLNDGGDVKEFVATIEESINKIMRNKVNKDKATTIKHVWDEDNDRWMYLEYTNYEVDGIDTNKLIGMNFMQGDFYEDFKEKWCENDRGMFEFYNSCFLYTFPIEKNSVSEIEFINKCMWAYHTAITEYTNYSYRCD
tara:strand:+ start:184 stop:681 length:498 start_codon:yes stop_codon:yes gene_type:complete